MKRFTAVLLTILLLLSLTACGTEAPKSADLNALFESCKAYMPEMSPMDENTMLNFYGIEMADCAQVITAVSVDGMRTDEIWLIEAKDAAALEKLQTLAENRLQYKADELITYNPDQYAVVEKGQILVEGNYLALIVCPEVDALAAEFKAAFE